MLFRDHQLLWPLRSFIFITILFFKYNKVQQYVLRLIMVISLVNKYVHLLSHNINGLHHISYYLQTLMIHKTIFYRAPLNVDDTITHNTTWEEFKTRYVGYFGHRHAFGMRPWCILQSTNLHAFHWQHKIWCLWFGENIKSIFQMKLFLWEMEAIWSLRSNVLKKNMNE